ncbi:hypothetical protein AYL99_08849 [Fonsecaea erecta]|uniref:Uncharacterized protein n=1 Tax=Fonsecaea erecta TaxID=1367422 RepID=A0A178ZAD6_9EURO|nr:hypothetical protein AYL99_08849 [Fonsecaea erecta]OAP56737.1 hypothetical protein AYL99_08849 [Fonsecaea erecta]
MATPPRFPSLSPDPSQNELDPSRAGGPSRPLSEITLIGTSTYSLSQIDGAGGQETAARTVRFEIDEVNRARLQRALWRALWQRRIRTVLGLIVKKFIFLNYFAANASMLIRMAVMASHDKHMQYDEALGWAFVQFLMLIVLLVRTLYQGIRYSQIELPPSLKITVACAGTLFLGLGLGVLPLFFI